MIAGLGIAQTRIDVKGVVRPTNSNSSIQPTSASVSDKSTDPLVSIGLQFPSTKWKSVQLGSKFVYAYMFTDFEGAEQNFSYIGTIRF